MIFYISDLHLGDKRLFDYCKRPFASLKEMKESMISKWNKKVTPNDTVYILGDIANGSVEEVRDFFTCVNGKKHLVVGNHDEAYIDGYSKTGLFESIERIAFIQDDNRQVCLCHYPMMDWYTNSKAIYHVYGHIHNKTIKNGQMYADIKNYYKDKNAFNASADVVGFEPVTLDELIALKEANKNDPYIN